ncbi:MAG: right-handed parallel beta-helix repeat-containing protein [Pyrinomonadaceae bacterium]
MNKLRLSLNALAFVVFTFAISSMAQAQATRTWVSGVGDDANPCSRTAPCKTFAGAISKTADGGEIDAIDPGGFGTITITKSITIDGAGTMASILAAGTNGVNFNDATNTKTASLRNLSINGAGTGINGINYIAGKTLHVENCVITGFKGSGANSHGIKVSLVNAGEVTVENTEIRDCTGNGIESTTTLAQIAISLDGVNVSKCATGIHLGNGSRGMVRDSEATHCTVGLTTDQTTLTTEANVESSVFALNGTAGIQAGGGTARVRISNVTLAQNAAAFSLAGGFVDTGTNNHIFGNTSNNAPNGLSFPPQ